MSERKYRKTVAEAERELANSPPRPPAEDAMLHREMTEDHIVVAQETMARGETAGRRPAEARSVRSLALRSEHRMTVEDELHKLIDQLDEETAPEALARLQDLRTSAALPAVLREVPIADEPGTEVERAAVAGIDHEE